jgi:hypothetical protein
LLPASTPSTFFSSTIFPAAAFFPAVVAANTDPLPCRHADGFSIRFPSRFPPAWKVIVSYCPAKKFHGMEVEFGGFPWHGTPIVRFFHGMEATFSKSSTSWNPRLSPLSAVGGLGHVEGVFGFALLLHEFSLFPLGFVEQVGLLEALLPHNSNRTIQ